MGLMYSFTGIVHFSVCLWQCAHEVGCGYIQCVCVCVCVYSMCMWCKSVVCVNWSFIMRYMHFGCSHRWLEKPHCSCKPHKHMYMTPPPLTSLTVWWI